MTYELHLPGVTRHLPICPVNENLSIAAFVLFGDTELTERSAEALAALAPPHDVMITAESKGIPLICSMARILGENRYILARKGPKLYMRDVIRYEVQSITTVLRIISSPRLEDTSTPVSVFPSSKGCKKDV